VDHLGKPDLSAPDPWTDFRKMFRLKRFPQVWVSASEPYEISLTKEFPYRDTYPFFKATYEEFGPKQIIWGTGYPKPRWELRMDKELEFVNSALDFYSPEDRELILGKNALRIWKFPKGRSHAKPLRPERGRLLGIHNGGWSATGNVGAGPSAGARQP
jgi:predicted TIM-barrel fold metal-dependent hydrolase